MNKHTILTAHNIVIRSGNGGNGKVSFRREKFVPKGGPDGGNGGNGGSVIIKADKSAEYLDIFSNRRHFYAPNGENGKNKMKYGKHGEDLYINLPLGTEIYDGDELIDDLMEDGKELIIAYGGKGGIGNMHLANSTDKLPLHSIPPTEGEEKILTFKLKIIAHVGLVGFPNAGKSSLINCLTNCYSPVGNYSFTTLIAHLGVLKDNEDHSMTIVDIPGLIENCSQGKGMGIEFLQNVERCPILALVLDGSMDYRYQYTTLMEELKNYDEKILSKDIIIVINKMDLLDPTGEIEAQKQWNYPVITISTSNYHNIEKLKEKLWEVYYYHKNKEDKYNKTHPHDTNSVKNN